MKKRICSILLMVCISFSCLFAFTGCSLFPENNKRYNAQVVAKVGDEEITRNDIATWFNYYYYTCYMYNEYTEEQVYDMALNNLVKFKIIINEAKHNKDLKLTTADKNDIWRQVFEYVDGVVDDYESDIKKRYGLEVKEDEPKEEEPTIFTEYSRKEVEYIIDYDQSSKELNDKYVAPKKEDNYYRYLAYKKYLKELKKSYEANYDEKLTEEEAFNEELNRYYKYYEDQKYVQKYNDYCLSNIEIADEAIIDRYVQIINSQMQEFDSNESYLSKITGTSHEEFVLYNDEDYQCFSVQQIVLSFNDMRSVTHNNGTVNASEYLFSLDGYVFDAEEKTELEKFRVDKYLELRDKYAYEGNIDMTYIDPETGKTTDEDGEKIVKTYADFEQELAAIINEYHAGDVEDEARIRKFVQDFYKLKFSYSKDGGVTDLTNIFNKVGYVFPSDEDQMTASWVSEFTNAAYEVYDDFKREGVYTTRTFVSNYGIHVLQFTGELNQGPVADKTIAALKSQYVSKTVDQTVYDYIHDLLLSEMLSSSSNSAYYFQSMLGENVSAVLYERVSSILYNQYVTQEKIEIKFPTYEDFK